MMFRLSLILLVLAGCAEDSSSGTVMRGPGQQP